MSDGNGNGHLLYLWSPQGYALVERDGEPPAVGTRIEENERAFRVSKVAPSPLPGDRRRCAYAQPA